MQIHFTKVRWKNFLNTGNAFTEITLDAHPTTLVLGRNGVGKSAMLDSICFALYGRAYRNINKPQLVNSINQRDCVVEIELRVGKKQIRIVRGMKPTIFEIWINEKLVDQTSAMKDSQAYLEETVLKMNFKSFTQIVVLGAASFVPFMQLPTSVRRELVEDILDIKIFSKMKGILAERLSGLKETQALNELEFTLAKERVAMKEEYIAALQGDRQTRLFEIASNIETERETISEAENGIMVDSAMRKQVEENTLPVLDVMRESIRAYEEDIRILETEIHRIEKTLGFYHDKDTCPTCKQAIDKTFKTQTVEDHNRDLLDRQERLQNLVDLSSAAQQSICDQQSALNEIEALKRSEERWGVLRNTSMQYLNKLDAERQALETTIGNIESEKTALRGLAKNVLDVAKQRSVLNEDRAYLDLAADLLKDSGIKAKVVKQYLPAINRIANKYLQQMDFFVSFELDETFKEFIRSRYRDEFSYESFSEGQKKRIDLALMFTWRQIAKMRSNASTNLLIMDEIFDSALDWAGRESVQNLLKLLGAKTNIWVISPTGDTLVEKFDHVVRFEEQQNFSVMV